MPWRRKRVHECGLPGVRGAGGGGYMRAVMAGLKPFDMSAHVCGESSRGSVNRVDGMAGIRDGSGEPR
eukprot:1859598-Prorocentrum_lima.AAC.1